MAIHNAPSHKLELVPSLLITKKLEQEPSLVIILKDKLLIDAANHNVIITGATRLTSYSWHILTSRQCYLRPSRKTRGTVPFGARAWLRGHCAVDRETYINIGNSGGT